MIYPLVSSSTYRYRTGRKLRSVTGRNHVLRSPCRYPTNRVTVVKSSRARKIVPKAPLGFFCVRNHSILLRSHLMELMPKSVLDAFRETGSQEYSPDPVVIAKYFYGSWTWYATEYEEDSQTFFGLVV